MDSTAEDNEETCHQAEVQGWSHFIAEETAVKIGFCLVFTHICPLVRVIQRPRITSVLMDLPLCVKRLQPLCLYINNKQPRLTRLHEGKPMTHGEKKNKKTETNQWVRCSEWLRGLLNPNKAHSQPTRCSAEAVINILSLLLGPPPMFVHSSPGKVSAMPIKPRQRPTIRSPWTTWMCADNRQTDLNHTFCLLDISVTD